MPMDIIYGFGTLKVAHNNFELGVLSKDKKKLYQKK